MIYYKTTMRGIVKILNDVDLMGPKLYLAPLDSRYVFSNDSGLWRRRRKNRQDRSLNLIFTRLLSGLLRLRNLFLRGRGLLRGLLGLGNLFLWNLFLRGRCLLSGLLSGLLRLGNLFLWN